MMRRRICAGLEPGLLLTVWLVGGCVTGTPYQRAAEIRDGQVSSSELLQDLHDPNWKVRCLAARACGLRGGKACVARIMKASHQDQDKRVRSCALGALVLACGGGGRSALARLVSAAPDLAQVDWHRLIEAVGRCPSADAVVSLWRQGIQRDQSPVALLRTAPPTDSKDVDARARWLRRVLELPAPNAVAAKLASRLKQAIAARDARLARERAEEARREAEAAKRARQEAARRKAALEKEARAALPKQPAKELAWLKKTGRDEVARILAHGKRVPAPTDPQWGTFQAWARTRQGVHLLRRLKVLLSKADAYTAVKAAYTTEKQKNDAAYVAPAVVPVPIFPEISGNYTFIKVLDQSQGDLLMMASDGAFVLRLAPGAYISNVYPGESINLTAYATGRTIPMTTGADLPLFISGSSPTRVVRRPGHRPNRRKEHRLRRKLHSIERWVGHHLRREAKGSDAYVVRQPDRRLRLETGSGPTDGTTWFTIGHQRGVAAFCLAQSPEVCPPARSYVSIADAVSGSPKDAKEEPFLVPLATSLSWSGKVPPLSVSKVSQVRPGAHGAAASRPATLTLTCGYSDPGLPATRSQSVGNPWFVLAGCGQGMPADMPPLASVAVVHSDPALQLRCWKKGDTDFDSPGWGDARKGCHSAAGFTRIEVREAPWADDSKTKAVSATCTRAGQADPDDCSEDGPAIESVAIEVHLAPSAREAVTANGAGASAGVLPGIGAQVRGQAACVRLDDEDGDTGDDEQAGRNDEDAASADDPKESAALQIDLSIPDADRLDDEDSKAYRSLARGLLARIQPDCYSAGDREKLAANVKAWQASSHSPAAAFIGRVLGGQVEQTIGPTSLYDTPLKLSFFRKSKAYPVLQELVRALRSTFLHTTWEKDIPLNEPYDMKRHAFVVSVSDSPEDMDDFLLRGFSLPRQSSRYDAKLVIPVPPRKAIKIENTDDVQVRVRFRVTGINARATSEGWCWSVADGYDDGDGDAQDGPPPCSSVRVTGIAFDDPKGTVLLDHLRDIANRERLHGE